MRKQNSEKLEEEVEKKYRKKEKRKRKQMRVSGADVKKIFRIKKDKN